jgi:hypothetical protein
MFRTLLLFLFSAQILIYNQKNKLPPQTLIIRIFFKNLTAAFFTKVINSQPYFHFLKSFQEIYYDESK